MTYQEAFITFLVRCRALSFGEFELKSGRIAPYFINTGMFDTGSKIKQLGEYYARAIQHYFGDAFDGIYGPAYKGIPLAVSTAMALADRGMDKGYLFNRKEAKRYADKSRVVGMPLSRETRLILVDDVITSGKAIRESMAILSTGDQPRIQGIVISVDRQEKGRTDQNALKEVGRELNVPVHSIVTLSDITTFLLNRKIDDRVFLDDAALAAITRYLETYGAMTASRHPVEMD